MLIDDIERYLALRRSLGFKLEQAGEYLGSFAAFAAARGEDHIHAKPPSSGRGRRRRRERDTTGTGISHVPHGSCMSKTPAMRFCRQASS
jgi:hypothetical protein